MQETKKENKKIILSFETHGNINSKHSLEMKNITKEFLGGKIIANDNVSIKIIRNEVHALVGENGSGKSTLMSILFGIYKPTAGKILINDEEIEIKTPMTAKKLGIGMVHQHYQLIENMSLIENAILGQEDSKVLSLSKSKERFKEISDQYGFNLNPNELVLNLTIGQKQKLEIVKVLWQEKEILVFDEPTAALSTVEIKEFLNIIKTFKKNGKTIIFISHKLNEVKQVADRISILRKGKMIKTDDSAKMNIDQISKSMVGELVKLKFNKPYKVQDEVLFEVKNISSFKQEGSQHLENINLKIKRGEIVGLAGIGENGQTELLEALTGLRDISSGEIILNKNSSMNIERMTIKQRQDFMVHVPEDRHRFAMAGSLSLLDNAVITNIDRKKFSKFWIEYPHRDVERGYNILKDSEEIKKWTTEIIKDMDVQGAGDYNSLARNLSGGNQQKFVVGREIKQPYDVLIAGHPTRGLDILSIRNIYQFIIDKSEQAAVILSSFELDELLAVCDRIAIIYKGKIVNIVDAKKASAQAEIAKYMVGGDK